jgi:DNA-binding response OmpR family regulator
MKVLLVDDDALLSDMYATKLGASGHEVTVALTAEQAVQQLQQSGSDFAVALLDMVMPGTSGVALIELITALPDPPAVVILTNQSESNEKTAALSAGAVDYIIKAETTPAEVVSAVEAVVNTPAS